MNKTLRAFVAVEISEPLRARAGELIAALDGSAANVKWVEPHNLHLTLKFLGETHQRQIADVCRAVERGAASVAPFHLEVRGAGAFPNAARPRTVWLGAGAGAEEMVLLHDRVEAELGELGFREEHRRFQTHLTIGRVRGGKRGQSPFVQSTRRAVPANGDGPLFLAELGALLKQHADFTAGVMTVEQLTVFSSRLTPAGPIYETIGTAKLM
ncbi:MAG: RNA 2',3'-cyclic phosphodiesterase [Pirellulales bacterium]|nr:RNA 2',3'-cyclic phosphodiesterase [Pirellulales bacterium]